MPFKKVNDIMLDILGWILILVPSARVIHLVIITPPGELTVKMLVPYFTISAVGIIYVVFKMTPLGKWIKSTSSAIIKKKTGHE